MAKRMQHCFWCGAKLGVFESWPGDVETCGEQACEREARNERAAQEADARERAREDDFDRYR